VLIDEQWRACITDFDLSFLSAIPGGNSPERSGGRWLAPELIKPESKSSPTRASDVYDFGSICLEVSRVELKTIFQALNLISSSAIHR
jgi:hypothetical protein